MIAPFSGIARGQPVKRYGLFTILFLALSFAAMAQAADSKPTWQREWKKIIEGAKKEGEVRLWGEQEIAHPEIRRPISTRRKFFSTGFYRAPARPFGKRL